MNTLIHYSDSAEGSVPSGFIPDDDRGLAYGDGVFETIRISKGCLSLADLHWQRLIQSIVVLEMTLTIKDVLSAVNVFLEERKPQSGILKIIVTRGSGGRGYNPAGCDSPRIILSLHDIPDYPEQVQQGIAVHLCRIRLGYSAFAGLKHLCRLDQVMARSEWADTKCFEGLLRDDKGYFIEGTMSNLFLVNKKGILLTPPVTRCGVAGVARQFILDHASEWKLSVRIQDIDAECLVKAREVFVVNSVNGVWPVTSCMDNKVQDNHGQSMQWKYGKITQFVQTRIMDALDG
ncbi:Aminodeoxychorismate lyase [invertebrate metagenome]|uniref:aminodeoxychorismate lyase n=1 Tax=invertebrate metagenome TaxID=1711999 RepID=A0A2H9T9X3_9ZZZZ